MASLERDQLMHMRTAFLLLAVFLAGCAVGQKHSYVNPSVEVPIKSSSKIAVAVHDRRPYVVSGVKSSTFVGLQRGGWGNPFDVNTESGAPLADDMQRTITGALERAGDAVVGVSLKPTTSPADAKAALLQTDATKFVLLTLHEWKSDQFANTTFSFDVTMDVFGPGGTAIATKHLAREDELGGGMSKSTMPGAFRRTLEELFWSEEVRQALR